MAPTINIPRIFIPNQPQCDLSHRFFGPSVNLFHSAVFELPDELILSILSHVAPDTQHTSHWVRFRIQHELGIGNYHQQRVQFLRPLSMTCRTMHLRLVPWIWERLELPELHLGAAPVFVRKLSTIAKALHAGIYPATFVK